MVHSAISTTLPGAFHAETTADTWNLAHEHPGPCRGQAAGRHLCRQQETRPRNQPRQRPGRPEGGCLGRHPQGRVLPGHQGGRLRYGPAAGAVVGPCRRPAPLTRSTRSSPSAWTGPSTRPWRTSSTSSSTSTTTRRWTPTRTSTCRGLVGLWEQIAARYKDRPAGVYFELLNEPHDKLTAAKWNAAIPRLLAAVREDQPDPPGHRRPGPVERHRDAGQAGAAAGGPPNLIVTVHSYDPFQFTHQGAPWVQGADKWKGESGPGPTPSRPPSATRSTRPRRGRRSTDRPVFLGEFGAYRGGGHGVAGALDPLRRPGGGDGSASVGRTGSSAPASAPMIPGPTRGERHSSPPCSNEFGEFLDQEGVRRRMTTFEDITAFVREEADAWQSNRFPTATTP